MLCLPTSLPSPTSQEGPRVDRHARESTPGAGAQGRSSERCWPDLMAGTGLGKAMVWCEDHQGEGREQGVSRGCSCSAVVVAVR